MSRTRLISPDLLLDGELADAERASGLPLRLTRALLPCFADREGRFEAQPRRLRAQMHPYDIELDMGAVLDQLERCGHVRRYQVDGKEFGEITDFHVIQRPHKREAASQIPAPGKGNDLGPAQGQPKADLGPQGRGPRQEATTTEADQGPHGGGVSVSVSDSVSESDPEEQPNHPPARASDGAQAWNEDRLREHLPESCWDDLRTVLRGSVGGAPAAARAIAAMCQLDAKLIPTGPGMQHCTTDEMGMTLNRMATTTHPSWHATLANRCLEAVRAEATRPVGRPGRSSRPESRRDQPLARTL